MSKPDLTIAEAVEAFAAFQLELGAEAHVSADLSLNWYRPKGLVFASIYPRDLTKGENFTVHADRWDDLLQASKDENAKREDLRRDHTIRSMALKIIELTADLGECTDRALRSEFPARDVQLYAKDAADKANDLAAGGPFAVLITDGANEMAVSQ